MGEITLNSCKSAIEFILLHNQQVCRPKHITLVICSAGGSAEAAFALIDIMKHSEIPVHTVGLGQIASAGLMIFIAGPKATDGLPLTPQYFRTNTPGVRMAKNTNYLRA